jgi:hypothetical protein
MTGTQRKLRQDIQMNDEARSSSHFKIETEKTSRGTKRWLWWIGGFIVDRAIPLEMATALVVEKWALIERECVAQSDSGIFTELLGFSGMTCTYCILFEHDGKCKGCPIYKKTKQHECHGTAYYRFAHYNFEHDGPKRLDAARDMLNLVKEIQAEEKI